MPFDELPEVLIAGRRAAYVSLHELCLRNGWSFTGPTVEQYDGKGAILINGGDVGPCIDAIVLEVVARTPRVDVIELLPKTPAPDPAEASPPNGSIWLEPSVLRSILQSALVCAVLYVAVLWR